MINGIYLAVDKGSINIWYFPAVQWLRFHICKAGGGVGGSIPGWRTQVLQGTKPKTKKRTETESSVHLCKGNDLIWKSMAGFTW